MLNNFEWIWIIWCWSIFKYATSIEYNEILPRCLEWLSFASYKYKDESHKIIFIVDIRKGNCGFKRNVSSSLNSLFNCLFYKVKIRAWLVRGSIVKTLGNLSYDYLKNNNCVVIYELKMKCTSINGCTQVNTPWQKFRISYSYKIPNLCWFRRSFVYGTTFYCWITQFE